MSDLFNSLRIGAITIPNRVVMAPMTRNRANADGVANELMARYYQQRASFGLIVSEGTQPESVGQGYPNTPGIHSDAQEAGWKEIASAVHNSGGHLFVQLMHAGRISHPEVMGEIPIAPSAIAAEGKIFTGTGMQPFPVPREMTSADLLSTKAAFVDAAVRAVRAGCDGVEIHGANGYLLHQFLSDNTNNRSDNYGGSPKNRARYVVEVTNAVCAAIGADRVGIRISPNGNFNDIHETEIKETYLELLDQISTLGLAYLHMCAQPGFDGLQWARKNWKGTLIANTGYADNDKIGSARELISSGGADAVSFARLAISNPDLPQRIKSGFPLAQPDSKTFYSGGEQGYIDYPSSS